MDNDAHECGWGPPLDTNPEKLHTWTKYFPESKSIIRKQIKSFLIFYVTQRCPVLKQFVQLEFIQVLYLELTVICNLYERKKINKN